MPRVSSVIFALLLAATLSVDAVAVYWFNTVSDGPATGTLCDALVASQLSVVTIWMFFGRSRQTLPLITLALATLVAAWTTANLLDRVSPMWEWTALYASHVTLLSILLWVFQRTRWWRPAAGPGTVARWQFSLAQLMTLMIVAALVTALLRDNELVRDVGGLVAVAIIVDSLLAVATVLAWMQPWAAASRVATLLAASGAAAWAATLWQPAWTIYVAVNWIIQCVVIFVWLEIGRIVPRTLTVPDAAGPPPT